MNHSKRLRLLAAAAIASSAAFSALAAAGPDANDTRKVFVGYLYGQPRHINFSLYTHLCHAFLVADEDGNVAEAQKRARPRADVARPTRPA